MHIASLKQLYIEELSDLYDAESQILKTLPKMIKTASSLGLRKGFTQHLEETKTHLERLDQLFDDMGGRPKTRKCKGMRAILEEGEEILNSGAHAELLDAAIIAAAQRVEHYEIAGYGCVRAYAGLLGDNDAAEMLQVTLDEEKMTDHTLTELAKQINFQALEANREPGTTLAPARRRKAGRA
ncbi:MAG: ferritin-like domain-containing protein [Acidobacteria bacterium]|nr:ferritin-like domain-containing protein [Acidobacteriota bacterium]MCI0724639.1 ferritin-like domain-containing protein [Acidobacteriota bacterium]